MKRTYENFQRIREKRDQSKSNNTMTNKHANERSHCLFTIKIILSEEITFISQETEHENVATEMFFASDLNAKNKQR